MNSFEALFVHSLDSWEIWSTFVGDMEHICSWIHGRYGSTFHEGAW